MLGNQCTEIWHLFEQSFYLPFIPLLLIFLLSVSKRTGTSTSPIAWLQPLGTQLTVRFWISIHALVLLIQFRQGYCVTRVLWGLVAGYWSWRLPGAPFWILILKAVGNVTFWVTLGVAIVVSGAFMCWTVTALDELWKLQVRRPEGQAQLGLLAMEVGDRKEKFDE